MIAWHALVFDCLFPVLSIGLAALAVFLSHEIEFLNKALRRERELNRNLLGAGTGASASNGES